MCFMSFPNHLGVLISSLQPGDEVIIMDGEGTPAVAGDTLDLIWKVDGYSALTIGGTSLSCHNISDLIVTGNHFNEFVVSEKAKEVWMRVQALMDVPRDMENFDSEPE